MLMGDVQKDIKFKKNCQNETGRGCEGHEREGAKKALSWRACF